MSPVFSSDAAGSIRDWRRENERLEEALAEAQADLAEMEQIGNEHLNNQIAVLETERDEAQTKLEAVAAVRDALRDLRPREGTVQFETLRQLDAILKGESE